MATITHEAAADLSWQCATDDLTTRMLLDLMGDAAT